MAKTTAVEVKPGLFQRLGTFYEEVLEEMRKVTWPSKDDLKVSTQVCMYMLIGMALIIFAMDTLFNNVVMALLNLFN